jgi:hypothetical protein
MRSELNPQTGVRKGLITSEIADTLAVITGRALGIGLEIARQPPPL